MKISELFYSIQGEGKRTGSPSFFIRTNHCNLRCKFPGGNLCDTPYTSWYPDDNKNLGEIEISEILDEYRKYNCGDIVISGGEPTMYASELTQLCKELKNINKDLIITIETNGTYSGDFVDHIDLLSISPKLSSSVPYKTAHEKMHQKNRINADVLRKFNALKENCKIDIQWKFVFNSEDDVSEIKELMDLVGFKNKDVYLMPEGITSEDLNKNRSGAIEACMKNQFNYTDRLHILVWGNTRGK
ncbi:MAG TPA: 7-carboxy-7-deazaguanine synthase QueE [Ignavibacteria bacterium]|nr:7-carboxy-7-deazaguanine synthase QueE [Ignavibacteria bacterium]HMR39864.1 7-carboxy-7-deazaguanine synthase QueE [Ignavibacteria bacterium]